MAWKGKKWVARRIYTRLAGFGMSLLLSLVIVTVYVLSQPEFNLIRSMGILDIFEAKTFDLRFCLRGNRQPGDDIIIIAMDEKTEDELGRWQSSGRHWMAQLVDILHNAGAKVIGFDLTLAEPDEGAVLEAVDTIKTRYQENHQSDRSIRVDMLSYLDEIKTAYDYDRRLAEAIQRAGNVVLGIYHFFNQADAAHLTPEKHETCRQLINRLKYTMIKFPPGMTQQPLQIPHSFGVEPNLPILSDAAKSCGHFTFIPVCDGYIRQALLLVEYAEEYYPSLDLEVVRTYLNSPLPPLIHALGKEGGGSVHEIQLGNIHIPTNEEGKLLINYYGPARTFPHYSLSDVIHGTVPPETFQDKIVLFGFTGAIYQDVHSVPFQPETYPGVEVHAPIIENIIREDFLTRPEWTILVDPLIIFLLGVVLGIALPQMRTFSEVFTILICLIVVAVIAHLVFLFWQAWLNVSFPFMFIILNYLAITSYKYFTEEKQKREIKSAFQHYVASTVVEQMLEKGGELKLGEEQKILTALFADIRGFFTKISEKMGPEALVPFFDEFFAAMTEVVLDYEGTVDKYIGDAMMVFYGAPIDQEDHAIRACKTAVDMLFRLEELRVRWKARNLPCVNIGVGINSGEMSVGNIGSEERFDYTIVGDNVNLASRLEGINKEYGTNILISQFTCDLIRHNDFTVRELDSVRVKGKNEPVTIYELLGYETFYQHMQPLATTFSEGLEAYRKRQWDQAIVSFQEALRLYPDDQPSKIYIKRCKAYKRKPPPEDWDGVFVMKSK